MTSAPAPCTARSSLVETLHGHRVPDPYRWLEDGSDPSVQQWAQEQDAWFLHHRDRWHERPIWAARLAEQALSQWTGSPLCRGRYQFFEQQQAQEPYPVVWVRRGDHPARVLLDPVRLDPSGRTRVTAWRPSWEGDRIAYLLSTAGSDISQLWVMSVDDGTVLDGPVPGMRTPSLAWMPGGDAFFYVRADHDPREASTAAGYGMRVLRHRVGTPVHSDEHVFGQAGPATYFAVTIDHRGTWLAVTAAEGSSARNDVHLAPVTTAGEPWKFQQVIDSTLTAGQWRPQFAPDGTLHLLTDYQAPGGRILTYPGPLHPDAPDTWPELLPPQDNRLLDDCVWVTSDTGNSQLLVLSAVGAGNELTLHHGDGQPPHRVPLPGHGAVSALRSHPQGGPDAWFLYTDRTTAPTLYHYDTHTHQARPAQHTRPRPARPTAPPVTSRQDSYPSHDGVPVDLQLLLPASDEDQLPRPLLLTAYGGFGAFVRPSYSPLAQAWVAAGGIYAVAAVRGGGDRGTAWHQAGRRAYKKTTVHDFNAAAQHLINSGLTTPGQLAAHGGSHGGLVVTAALTQRPDLYAAVLASGPLCDMVRYEHLGIGHTWTDEFGTASDPEQLTWLLSYSPYHHVKPHTPYPAVLLAGAVTDERTGDAHPRKMCAALQHATTSNNPVLLRRQTDAGHGPSDQTTARETLTDIITFLATHTGLRPVT
ncbi:prolyl endopeptidase [Streptomyces tauricus]|uniref:prolyl oligopeptidase family serine peptidase n=1 Tax=Streptomyces tauricus TaxID=68274 RepID=UPI00167A6052|nr:prolyl oligopeptidase family serine peptidase [Streptomyces tauricus]GHA70290.1 prolyl endopeptidase [Streptomyces tauricus]